MRACPTHRILGLSTLLYARHGVVSPSAVCPHSPCRPDDTNPRRPEPQEARLQVRHRCVFRSTARTSKTFVGRRRRSGIRLHRATASPRHACLRLLLRLCRQAYSSVAGNFIHSCCRQRIAAFGVGCSLVPSLLPTLADADHRWHHFRTTARRYTRFLLQMFIDLMKPP